MEVVWFLYNFTVTGGKQSSIVSPLHQRDARLLVLDSRMCVVRHGHVDRVGAFTPIRRLTQQRVSHGARLTRLNANLQPVVLDAPRLGFLP